MIDFISDIINIIKLKRIQKKIKYCFFVENYFIYQYLKPYIDKKKDENSIIFSFEKLDLNNCNKKIFVLKSTFFRTFFFMTLKFKILITSTPDLENSIFKKSKFRLTKYIYIQHSPLSLTKIYDENAFLAFDVVQTVNMYQYNEIKKINKIYGKKIKALKSGYKFLKEKVSSTNLKKNIKVLIAPTWHSNFYTLKLHIELIKIFESRNIDYVLRPHPMSIKKKEISLEELINNNINYDCQNELNLDVYTDLITDWSGIFLEYAIIKKKFPILINTKQKIRNINHQIVKDIPIEIVARNILAHSLDVANIKQITDFIGINSMNEKLIINNFYNKYFF